MCFVLQEEAEEAEEEKRATEEALEQERNQLAAALERLANVQASGMAGECVAHCRLHVHRRWGFRLFAICYSSHLH